ncbi:MAG: gamma-glutamylcyclotransferase family protein, partial [Nocardioidaceae bacterium]
MPLYAAYGSNLDPRRMLERCPHSPLRGTGWLTGWRLTFGGEEHGWDGALPTLVEDLLDQVFVALYDARGADVRRLDEWESVDTGLYRKVRVRVATLTGEQVAWAYVLDAFEGGLPSA